MKFAKMQRIKYENLAFGFMWVSLFALLLSASVRAELDEDDCELYAPSTMHDFCCDMHDEYMEFQNCEIEWHDKIVSNSKKAEMNLNFCISECVYNETNYLGKDRKSLRMKIIKRHLSEMHGDHESEALLLRIFEACHTHALEMLEHESVQKLEERLKAYNCHPYPGLVFECVSNEVIVKCPPEKFHNTAQCEHVKEYLDACLKPKVHV